MKATQYEVENRYQASILFETSLAIQGYSYLVIYGQHINGYFCCIPNKHWGCEMSRPEEVGYNADKLIECGASGEVADTIAKAIYELCG